jgi:hypothetical protein
LVVDARYLMVKPIEIVFVISKESYCLILKTSNCFISRLMASEANYNFIIGFPVTFGMGG